MASDGGGKFKSKRSGTPSKPYTRRQSLLTRVTDRVKDILSPSWLVDMVSTVKKDSSQQVQQPTVTAAATEQVNSMTFADHRISANNHITTSAVPVVISSSNNTTAVISQHSSVESHHASVSSQHAPVIVKKPLKQAPFTSSQFQFEDFTICKENVLNGDDHSEHSEVSVSTSGCSSLVPHPDRREYQQEILQLNELNLDRLGKDLMNVMPGGRNTSLHPEQTDLVNKSNMVSSGSFLWSQDGGVKSKGSGRQISHSLSIQHPHSKPQEPAAKAEKPNFNISLFGSSFNLSDNNTSCLNDSRQDSPYYPGKTMYGGATSQRRSTSSLSTPYQVNAANRRQTKAKPLDTSKGALSSSTAKRILDTLERMSTPLSDAKKIPSNESFNTDSPLAFTPSSYKNTRRVGRSQSCRSANEAPMFGGPPVNRLNTPSIASIARNRQPITPGQLQNSIKPPQKSNESESNPDGQKKVVQSVSDTSEASQSTAASGHSGKMRRERSGKHYSTKKDEESDKEMVELPTGFTLPLMGLPSFSFGIPTASKESHTSTASDAGSNPLKSVSSSQMSQKSAGANQFKPVSSPQMSGKSDSPPSYTFSSPIAKPDPSSPGSPQQPFTFSSPILKEGSDSPSQVSLTSSSPEQMKSVHLKDPAKSYSTAFLSSGLKPNGDLKSGSVMDVLGKSKPAEPSGGSGIQPTSELKKGSVMDILSPKTDKINSSLPSFQPAADLKKGSVMDILGKGGVSSSLGNSKQDKAPLSSLFKKAEGSWECEACMVSNKASQDKCVACMTVKPAGKTEAKLTDQIPKPAGVPLTSMFQKASGSWECPVCMINNKPEADKCVACTTPNPKSKTGAPSSDSQIPKPTGPPLTGMFQKASGSWECPVCMINNKAELDKCAACTTPNPKSKQNVPSSGFQIPKPTGPPLTGMFQKASGSWECPVCMINNKAELDKCAACTTPNPKATKSPAASTLSTVQKTGAGFGDKFKKPSGSWECDTCMVPNKAEASKCVACETPRPGAKPVTGFSTSVTFNFDVSSANIGGFKFGGSVGTDSQSTGIKFGSDSVNTSSTSSTVLSGGFKFGSDSEAKMTVLPSGGLKFGSSGAEQNSGKSTAAAIVSGSSTVTNKDDSASKPLAGGFSFNASKSAVSASSTTSSLLPAGFKFGTSKPTDSKDGEVKTTSASGLFNFNAPKMTASDSGALGVGGSQPSEIKSESIASSKISTSNPVLSSASTSLSSQSVTSNSKTKPAPGGFNFGQKPLETGGFKFGPPGGTTDSKLTSENSTKPASGGFTFNQPNTAENNADSSKLPAGGFSLKTNNSESTTKRGTEPVAGGFSFPTQKDPAPKPTAPAPATGGFSFSAAKTESNQLSGTNKRGRDDDSAPGAKKPNFSFGASSTEDKTSDTAPSVFKFGSKDNPPNFNFSANSGSGVVSSGSDTAPGLFTFGQSTSAKPNSGGLGTNSLFGQGAAVSTTSGSTAPVFGGVFGSSASAPPSTDPTPSGGFKFNNVPSTTFNSSTTGSGMFQFDAKKNEQPNTNPPGGAFVFGQQQQQPSTAGVAPPSFNFGSSSSTFTGFSAAPGGQPSAPAAAAPFQFGANPPAGNANPFSVMPAAGSNTTPGRKIKKAVRKIRK